MTGSQAYCTGAPKSLSEPTDPVDYDFECEYLDYNNYRAPTESIVRSKKADCGYNSDKKAYCSVHKGDKMYREYID
jgi:hypothetical protein